MTVPLAFQAESVSVPIISGLFLSLFLYWLYKQAFGTDIPVINGIPEAPGAIPFYGHLRKLGHDHPTHFQNWAVENQWPVFQAKLGNRRIVVLNTFAAAQEWIHKNASALIDRPLFYTFHGILSTTQGGTIGTAPWDESCKRRRTAVGTIMTRPAIQKSAPMLDQEVTALVKDMFLASKEHDGKSDTEIDPRILFQRMAINITLMMCYSTRMKDINDPMLHNLLYIAHSVSTFRSTSNNIQDYVPFYRYLPTSPRTKLAIENRNKRDMFLEELLNKVQCATDEGKSISCLSQGLLLEKDGAKLTKSEIRSINVSLVSGGFETLSTTGLAALSYLSSPEGQRIQEKAYNAIRAVYSSPEEAWQKCLTEETVPYLVALVRESLRYYAAIQLLPPRQTYKEFKWQGLMIPKGVVVYMNAQAINHDKEAYGPDADEFRPERWLEDTDQSYDAENTHNQRYKVDLPHHYSYGAGSRMCTAVALSNRILYAVFVRLILHFRFIQSETMPPNTDYIDFNEDRSGQSAIPKRFKVRVVERLDREVLMENIERSEVATRDIPMV